MSGPSYCRRELRRLLIAGTVPEWLQKHSRRRYIISAVLASPPWVKRSDFDKLEARKKQLTEQYGIKHVLAHIVPLTHHNVCGLNVPWNIKVVTWYANATESNVWYDEPETLLPAFEQFRLFG